LYRAVLSCFLDTERILAKIEPLIVVREEILPLRKIETLREKPWLFVALILNVSNEEVTGRLGDLQFLTPVPQILNLLSNAGIHFPPKAVSSLFRSRQFLSQVVHRILLKMFVLPLSATESFIREMARLKQMYMNKFGKAFIVFVLIFSSHVDSLRMFTWPGSFHISSAG